MKTPSTGEKVRMIIERIKCLYEKNGEIMKRFYYEDPYHPGTHYNEVFECDNCGSNILVLIPHGTTIAKHFKNNDIPCKNCKVVLTKKPKLIESFPGII